MKCTVKMVSFSVVLVLLFLTTVVAQAGFDDNFDSYPAGTLVPQGGWQGWDSAPAASGAVVTAARAVSAPHSVLVSGDNDLVHQFSGATSGEWIFSAQQYIPSGGTNSTYAILMNLYSDGGPYEWASQLHFDKSTGKVYSENLTTGNPNLPLITNNWVELKWDINLGTNSVSEYYGGTLLSTHEWADTANGKTVKGVAAIDLYANNDQGSSAYYDNIRLAPVPEPSTLALLGVGTFGLLGYAWRRRRT
jgi:hypothetical protein